MNTNSHQDAQSPHLPFIAISAATLATTPKPTDATKKPICKNFLWGICDRHDSCKFAHIIDKEEMKSVLKFCHDFQNKGGCTRKDCAYLHTTREEQNLFYALGELPSCLVERHAAMAKAKQSAATASSPPTPTPTPLRPPTQTPLQPPTPTPLQPPTPLRPTPLRPQPPTPLRPAPLTLTQLWPPPPPPPPPVPSLRPCSPSMQFPSYIPQMSSGNIGPQTTEFFATISPATMLSNLINSDNLKRSGQPADKAPPYKRTMEGVHVADSSSYLETRRIEAYKLILERKEFIKEKAKKDLVKFLREYFELDPIDDDLGVDYSSL